MIWHMSQPNSFKKTSRQASAAPRTRSREIASGTQRVLAKGGARTLLLPDPSPSFWISLRYLNWMRMLVPIGLLASTWLFEAKNVLQEINQTQFIWLAGSYLLVSVFFLLVMWQWQRRFYLQLFTHIIADIAFIALLMFAGGAGSSFRGSIGVLMLLPVAGAAILSPLLLSLMFAAIAALVLLAGAFYLLLSNESATAALVQAGLTGFACFVTALLMNSVARRLVRQEQLAEKRGQDLANQMAVNKLIIADMPNGVVVMSESGQVRNYNPAAADLLGVPSATGFEPGWQRLQENFHRWRRKPDWNHEVVDFDVPPNLVTVSSLIPQNTRRIRARFVAPSVRDVPTGECLIFLEDLGVVEARAQQLKLAAMGRLSASIAHEIRNPLSAVRHASALLGEDSDNPTQRKLTSIIEINTQRINRIVEDVLQLSRRQPVQAAPLCVAPFLQKFVDEYCEEQGVAGQRLQFRNLLAETLASTTAIHFDEAQLRRVLVNLVSNALRYAGDGVGAVCVFCQMGAPKNGLAQVELGVADNGPGLTAAVREHLYEPFFTTDARGTGLGLYIARELCLVNQATMNYRHVSALADCAQEVFCIRAALAA